MLNSVIQQILTNGKEFWKLSPDGFAIGAVVFAITNPNIRLLVAIIPRIIRFLLVDFVKSFLRVATSGRYCNMLSSGLRANIGISLGLLGHSIVKTVPLL